MMDKRAGERGKFQSRVDVRWGGGGGGGWGLGVVVVCMCNNEGRQQGRQRTGQSGKTTDWSVREDNRLVSQGRQPTGQSGKTTDWSIREDNRLVNQGRQPTGQSGKTTDWSVCKRLAADAAATEQASDLLSVLCSVCNHGFIQLLLFVLAARCIGLPSEVTAILDKEGFTSLASLKHSTDDDIKELSLRRAKP